MDGISVCGSFSQLGDDLMGHIACNKVDTVIVIAVFGEVALALEVYDISHFVLYRSHSCILDGRK